MPSNNVFTTRGFDAFRQGSFGNAGQNLYVSAAGVLQRIHQYDLNSDGYVDLVFCNSQNHWEKPPAYVYLNPLNSDQRVDLPSDGAWSGAVVDLNGDGYDDLVLGMKYNGVRFELNAFIYYGSPSGWSENRQQQLPAPRCTSVAVGDFNGDGRPDIALLCSGRVRLFYQSSLGFEPSRCVDLPISGDQLAAHDLDGDGYAELLVRDAEGVVSVYWGGPNGLDASHSSTVPVPLDGPATEADGYRNVAEYVDEAKPLVKTVVWQGVPHVFVARRQVVYLTPVGPDRSFGASIELACRYALSIVMGDVNGDGQPDLVLACREPSNSGEQSWVYWGSGTRFDDTRRTAFATDRACDVAVAELDGDGLAEIVMCQSHTAASFTTESVIFRGTREGSLVEARRLVTEDARRVFVAQSSDQSQPQVVFVNYFSRNLIGNIQPTIYFGGPDGFSPERKQDVPGWGAVEAICCDINDDGRVDLVLANAAENAVYLDPGSYVLLNGSTGFPDAPSQIIPTARAHGVCCADLNQDGYLDLIFCGFNNSELLIFYGGPNSLDTANPTRITLTHDGVTYREPRWMYLADLNHDGWLDLVVPIIVADRSFILWGGPQGFSMDRCQALSVHHAACARAADLTGNGYVDLIVGGHMPTPGAPHDSFLYIYWNGPHGLHEDRRAMLPAKTINSISVADFNNDGALDIFICSYHDGKERDIDAYLYWNRTGRGFSAADHTRLFNHSSSGSVAADFNEDGWVDLAIAYHKVHGDHVGHSAVWWNGPDGFAAGRVTRLPTSGPHGMTAVGIGNIVDRGPDEYYISAPFQLPNGAHVTGIQWQADTPVKTWVKAQLRRAPKAEALADAPWHGPTGSDSWFENGAAVPDETTPGGWAQYRLALGAVNSGSTPRVAAVNVHYD